MNTQKRSLSSRNIAWRGLGTDLSPGLSDYVESRLETLEKILNTTTGDLMYNIEVGKTSEHHKHGEEVYKAEIQINWNGKTFFAKSTSNSVNSAIDDVRDELAAQLRKYKGKSASRLRKGGEKIKNMLRGLFNREE